MATTMMTERGRLLHRHRRQQPAPSGLTCHRCFGAVLPVYVTSVLQDGILEQLHLCQLGSKVPNEKGTKESANGSSLP